MGNSCVWIISKTAAAPLRRKRFSTKCGVPPMSSMSEKVRAIACRSFRKSIRSNAEESLANAEGFPCKAARRVLARLEAVDSLSLSFHSALCITVHGGAKFGGALPQPFVCLADRTRPMSHEFRVSVRHHCQHFGN